MNPCKCGFYGEPKRQCSKAPKCALEYRNRISGPILDRFDIVIYVNSIKPTAIITTTIASNNHAANLFIIEALFKE